MPDTNDIDALLLYLKTGRTPNWKKSSTRWHAALTALVAERDKAKSDFSDAWRERSEFAKRIDQADAALAAALEDRDEYRSRCKAQQEDMADLVGKQREADHDLRERLVCAALTAMVMAEASYVDAAEGAVCYADATLAAMRKGEA